MSMHTPGPWSLSEPSGGWVIVHQNPHDWDGMGYAAVCRLPLSRKGTHFRDIEEANARLIAAAPELLDALVALVNAESPEGSQNYGQTESECDAYKLAFAAIAKATGEQA